MMPGFQPGELIFLSKPYVYVLNNELRGQRCDHCFTRNDGLKRCSGCSYLYFCDRNCQKKAWDDHKMECKLLKEVSPNELPQPAFLLSRILFKVKKLGVDEPFEDCYGHKMNYRRLMSHSDNVDEELIDTSHEILSFYLKGKDVPSPSDLRVMIGKMNTNIFGILDDQMGSIGSGIYLGAAIFDHSCEPDAEVIFNGLDLSIRAVKEIPHKDVTKIYISYFNQLQLLEDRQNYLKETYFFTCQCPRCTSPNYENLLTKTLVDETECALKLNEFKEKVACIEQMVKNKANQSSIYYACMDELQKQHNILADTHIYRIKILEYAFGACIENKQWNEAAGFGKQLTKPYKLLYGKYHPDVGIHLFKLGKIQNILRLFKSAKENLFQAQEILKITHGKDHPLYKVLLNDYQYACSAQ